MDFLSIIDILLPPVYLATIYFISRMIQRKKITQFPEYKYYIQGLTAKIVAGIVFGCVYLFYYHGGDTTQYFIDSLSVNRLIFKNPPLGLDVLFHGMTINKLAYFDSDIGFPVYFRDPSTSLVVQVTTFLSLFTFRSFITTTILVSYISFQGIWYLYRVFLYEFPHLGKEIAIAILFIPSVLFWGSGIMKDTYTLSAVGYFTYSFYMLFFKRKKVIWQMIVLIASGYLILLIKAYILIALLPGVFLWLGIEQLSKISSEVLRILIGPLTIIIVLIGVYAIIMSMGSSFGKFSADKVLDRAVVTQRDLKMDYYKGNSFDIGEFDSSIGSILSVSHKAWFAGLFRPFILEANTFFMFVSGVENLILLILLIINLYNSKVIGFFKFFARQPLLTFSLLFSFFFAFSVGLSTSNFGSMVRYKIPAIPFFVASMFIIRDYLAKEKKERIVKRQDIDFRPVR